MPESSSKEKSSSFCNMGLIISTVNCQNLNRSLVTVNVPVVYIGRENGFGWGKIHNKGPLKGWALKSRLFWALKWHRVQRVPFGPKKVKISLL
jgi:hypothetical protein